MASHVAASAYGHCLAVVRDAEAAAELAAVAVRRGGRTLASVLGHARHQALAAAVRTPPPVELGPDATAPDVAWALAATRPPVELSTIDLSGRHGLGRAGLGLALGLSPAAAAARVAEVARRWDEELDPALLAWLGPGDCGGLAAVLAGRPLATAADLLAVAAPVADHTEACDACGDRRRAAASVRQLVAGTPLPAAPAAVAAAAARHRFQPGVPPPPLMTGRRRTTTVALAGAVVTVALAGALLAVRAGDSADRQPSLAALGSMPSSDSALELLPSVLELAAGRVSLVNTSDAEVAWEAGADAVWLQVEPRRGRLGPRREQVLRFSGNAPEGDIRTTLRVEGDDGSAAAATLTGTVEHPPDLGATAQGCRVSAVVEDEAEVALTLHARDAAGAERRLPMAPGETDAAADLPAGVPLTWWVSAIDGRGNQARTPDVALPRGC